jgi:hypothetical protein
MPKTLVPRLLHIVRDTVGRIVPRVVADHLDPESTHRTPEAPPTATPVDSSHVTSSTAVPGAGKDAVAPEWRTEEWKHHVEAEARKQLKDHIRDVGAPRK